MARAMGGDPNRENSKDNERGARFSGGAAGKYLVGQQPSEPGGALDERRAH